MKTLQFRLKPLGPFATPLQGDTLFGQLCWTVLREWGEEKLRSLLAVYGAAPFSVISDAFPAGYLPRPHLPASMLGVKQDDAALRKEMKRKQWIPLASTVKPVACWIDDAKSDTDILNAIPHMKATELVESVRHMHNTIDRATGTTGDGFAPYAVDELWHATGLEWDLYILLNEEQLSQSDLEMLIRRIGVTGYGKDANLGAGRFSVENVSVLEFPVPAAANALLTLANCAPQGLDLNPERSFYQPFTRYGRHGDWATLVNPYKAPLLLTQRGSVFTPVKPTNSTFLGQAIGGNGEVSNTIPETVHQGYAPVVRIQLPV